MVVGISLLPRGGWAEPAEPSPGKADRSDVRREERVISTDGLPGEWANRGAEGYWNKTRDLQFFVSRIDPGRRADGVPLQRTATLLIDSMADAVRKEGLTVRSALTEEVSIQSKDVSVRCVIGAGPKYQRSFACVFSKEPGRWFLTIEVYAYKTFTEPQFVRIANALVQPVLDKAGTWTRD
jgi:hypothetical protein